jgi:succinylglutamic semialdehyde dehydrogenase
MGPVINAAAAQHLVAKQDELIAAGGVELHRLEHLEPDTGLVSPGLIDTTPIADLPDEEHFGPLLKVRRVESFEDAIAEANRTAYGLSAGLVSSQADHYERFRAQIRAGIINWNTPITGASGAAPFGGLGLSGNHRPSGFFAADYCSYAVASMEKDALDPEAALPPGLRAD